MRLSRRALQRPGCGRTAGRPYYRLQDFAPKERQSLAQGAPALGQSSLCLCGERLEQSQLLHSQIGPRFKGGDRNPDQANPLFGITKFF